jgi:LysM repeat protein
MNAVRARCPSLAQPVSALLALLLSIPAGAQTPVYRQPGSAYTTRAMRGGSLPSAAYAPDNRRSESPVARPAASPPPPRTSQEHRVARLETSKGAPRTVSAAKTTSEMPTTYVVRPGDTLSDIAVRHGLTTDTLRAANGLTHDVLRIGQTLSLKPGRLPVPNGADAYVVQPGETFTDIALRYRIHPDDLARANPTVYPDRLLVGETLKIPAAKAGQAAPLAEPPAAAEPSKPGKAVALRSHVVAPGESLGSIAKRHGIATAALAAANGLKNPNHIVPGQRLVVPGATVAAPAAPPPPAAEAQPQVAAAPAVEAAPADLPLAAAPAAPAATPEPSLAPTEPVPMGPPEAVAAPEPLRVAAPRGIMAYLLEPGDDLPKLAVRFGTTVEQLRAMNKLAPDRQLGPGDEIIVPAAGAISLN